MFANLPLSGLRAFEAAARLLSFKQAALELAVTPTAISHQIRNLERRLGVALFERKPRALALTAKGAQLFEQVHSALQDIAQTLERLRPVPSLGTLTVTTTHSFAALWLVPRLGRFYDAFPGYQVRLETSAEVVDLRQNASVDVAIRYGGGPYPGLREVAVLAERFGVYGTPAKVAAASRQVPARITVHWRDSTLYEDAWRRWCEAAGEPWLGREARVYDEENYALQAAIAGQGLVMASSVMVAEAVARGLLSPYRPEVTVPGTAYAVLCAAGRERHPPAAAFLTWITAQFEESAQSKVMPRRRPTSS